MKNFSGFEMPKTLRAQSQTQSLIRAFIILAIIAFVVDYVTLPAYNYHDVGFITLIVIYLFIFGSLYSVFSHRFDLITRGSYTLAFLLIAFIITFIFALWSDSIILGIFSILLIIISLINVIGEFKQMSMEYSSSEYNLEYKIVTIEKHGIEKKDTIYVLTRKDLDNKSKR